MIDKLKPLMLGDLEIKVPIIQGGMGVKVSTAPLASAVADCGGGGTIASVGLAYGTPANEKNYLEASKESLRTEIRKAKTLTSGVVGINIMVALTNYEDLVRVSAQEKADFIVSGAGLPMRLPEYVKGSSIKLIPIVSSGKAANIILKTWNRRYQRSGVHYRYLYEIGTHFSGGWFLLCVAYHRGAERLQGHGRHLGRC